MTLRETTMPDVDMIILPPVRDLGDGFAVRRALPSAHRRMVGPFIFFDQFGPTTFAAGNGLDVRPHPHIGLATVSYLLEGEILHRDSLGYTQAIRPGAVNWMTAGRGIVHSERSADDTRAAGGNLFGLQTWVALPQSHEETDPAFFHHPADSIPQAEAGGVTLRVVAGSCDGLTSPVQTFSDMLYADVALADGARYRLTAEHIERAIYVITGAIAVEGQEGGFTASELVILKPDVEIVIRAVGPARIMLVGGEPLSEARNIFWNFVSSSKDRIEQAKEDWQQNRFPGVPGDSEFIPLPA